MDAEHDYTGHAFRPTAATCLADSGADSANLKRFGGWKFDTIAQSYITESHSNKRLLAQMIEGSTTPTSSMGKSVDHNHQGKDSTNINIYFANCEFIGCNIETKIENIKRCKQDDDL